MPAALLLLLAIVFEVAGTVSMKLSQGFTQLWPSLLMLLFYGTAFFSFVACISRIEISTAYALWTALGMLAISVIDILIFGSSLSWMKLISFITIVAGVVWLTLDKAEQQEKS